MTEDESMLWSRLRGKQIMGVQFYLQKPIGNYIVDFFAPKAKLVVEVEGLQHKQTKHEKKDNLRDGYLSSKGIEMLRFNAKSPPAPFSKGGSIIGNTKFLYLKESGRNRGMKIGD